MKKTISFLMVLIAGVSVTSAATYCVNFGANSNISSVSNSEEWISINSMTANATYEIAVGSGISISSSTNLSSVSNFAGSQTASSPTTNWTAFTQAEDLFGTSMRSSLVNAANGGTRTNSLASGSAGTFMLTLSGLTVGETYTLGFFVGRHSAGSNAKLTLGGVDTIDSAFARGYNAGDIAKSPGVSLTSDFKALNLGSGELDYYEATFKATSDNVTVSFLTTASGMGLSAMSLRVPEPTTASLSLVALAGVMLRRRRC